MTNRLNSKLVAATAAVLVLGLTSGCVGGGGSSNSSTSAPSAASGAALTGTLDVRVYGDWPFVKRNAESFMQANPNVKINVGGIDNDELRQSGGREFTSSDAPDIVSFTYNTPVIEEWVAAGALTNVDDMWTDQLKSVLPDSVKEGAKASDGHYYAVPLGLTILPTAFYDKDALTKAGVAAPTNRSFGSLDEFNKMLGTLKSKGFDQPLGAPGQSLAEVLFFATVSSSCGGDTYKKLVQNWKDKTAPKYTDACAVKAIQTMADWGKAGYLPKGYAQVTYDQSQGLFGKNSALWVAGSWAPPVFTPSFPWDWATLPSVDPANKPYMGIGVDSFLIPSHAKNKAVAKAFIEYMTSTAVLEQGMGRVPARTDVDLTKVIGNNAVEVSIAKEVSNYGQLPYYGISVPASVLEAMVTNVADGAVSGRLTADAAAAALQKAADDYRSQNGG